MRKVHDILIHPLSYVCTKRETVRTNCLINKVMSVRCFLFLLAIMRTTPSCFKPNVTWLSGDILNVQRPVADPFLCQTICGDTEQCVAFSWTTSNNAQFELECFLFSSISNQTSFHECISGPASCTCSSELACHGGDDNIVDQILAVQTEAECQNLCFEDSSCGFYTWHNAGSFPPYFCVLINLCENTVPCQGCFSGPPECSHEVSSTTPTPTMEGKIKNLFIYEHHFPNRIIKLCKSLGTFSYLLEFQGPTDT